MSTRIRGQEVTLRVTVDGVTLAGSMLKVVDFTATPRSELTESPMLGELEDDIDIQHSGWDMSWTIHERDAVALDLMDSIIRREQDGDQHPQITITVIRAFRDPGVANRVHVYHQCILKSDSENVGGRKEYNTVPFSAKARRRSSI